MKVKPLHDRVLDIRPAARLERLDPARMKRARDDRQHGQRADGGRFALVDPGRDVRAERRRRGRRHERRTGGRTVTRANQSVDGSIPGRASAAQRKDRAGEDDRKRSDDCGPPSRRSELPRHSSPPVVVSGSNLPQIRETKTPVGFGPRMTQDFLS